MRQTFELFFWNQKKKFNKSWNEFIFTTTAVINVTARTEQETPKDFHVTIMMTSSLFITLTEWRVRLLWRRCVAAVVTIATLCCQCVGFAKPEALALSSKERELQKNTVTEVLVKGRFERADNCEFRCPCECCDSITHTTAQLKKHLKGCKYNLDPSAQPTFEIECFKCEELIYTGELKTLKVHARKCEKALAIHKYKHMPTCLTCNRFFFLEAALLKHIKLDHPPTAPQAIEDKSRTINLNCGT